MKLMDRYIAQTFLVNFVILVLKVIKSITQCKVKRRDT